MTSSLDKIEKAKEYVEQLTTCTITVIMLSEIYDNTVVFKGLFNDKWYTIRVEMDSQLNLKRLAIEV